MAAHADIVAVTVAVSRGIPDVVLRACINTGVGSLHKSMLCVSLQSFYLQLVKIVRL